MAPEQMLSSSAADHLSDIYGLGCTLFTLLVGRPPYAGTPRDAEAANPLRGPIPSLRQHRPDVPAPVDVVFRRMLAPRREERPQSMAEVIEAFQGS
jgi:serine/threonine-protein kinase